MQKATKHLVPALRMGSSVSTRSNRPAAPAARLPPPSRAAPPSLSGHSSVHSSPVHASHPAYPGYQTPHAAALAGGPYLANVAYPLQYDYMQQQYLQQPWNHLIDNADDQSSSEGEQDYAAAAAAAAGQLHSRLAFCPLPLPVSLVLRRPPAAPCVTPCYAEDERVLQLALQRSVEDVGGRRAAAGSGGGSFLTPDPALLCKEAALLRELAVRSPLLPD